MRPWLLFACAQTGPADAPVEPELDLVVLAAKVPSESPVVVDVELTLPPGWQAEPPAPAAAGLDAAAAPETAEDGATRVQRFTMTGPDGSYVITVPPLVARAPDGTEVTLEAQPIFVDVGVEGPVVGPLEPWEEAPPPAPVPWAWISAGAGAVALAAFFLARAMRRPAPIVPPPPPEWVAREAWRQARAQTTDEHALALALSQIFRRYVEAVTGYPATQRTTREILDHSAHERLFAAALLPRMSRLLDATDLLKFAREGGGTGFFEGLTDDLEALLTARQPPGGPDGVG